MRSFYWLDRGIAFLIGAIFGVSATVQAIERGISLSSIVRTPLWFAILLVTLIGLDLILLASLKVR